MHPFCIISHKTHSSPFLRLKIFKTQMVTYYFFSKGNLKHIQMLTTLEPRPRLSYSMVESVLGEDFSDPNRIESDMDAIFQSTLATHCNPSETPTQEFPSINQIPNTPGFGSTGSSVEFFPEPEHYQTYSQNVYQNFNHNEDWRVPPIQDCVQPGWTSTDYPSYDIHITTHVQSHAQFQTKPKQSRRSTADLDKKRIHKCTYHGKKNRLTDFLLFIIFSGSLSFELFRNIFFRETILNQYSIEKNSGKSF